MNDFRNRIKRIEKTLGPAEADGLFIIFDDGENSVVSGETFEKRKRECLKRGLRIMIASPEENILELPERTAHDVHLQNPLREI
jgi:hypothetical protein